MPFEIANIQCENPEVAAHTRIGWFRSVSNIPHAFAVQSMVGGLARATNRDQKDMLLELIGSRRIVDLSSVKDLWNYGEPYDSYPIDTARLRKVVELVAEKGGWGRPVPKGHGLGIAVHRSFVSYIATIVEVAVDDKGKLTVPRIDIAIDCGTYVNPERIQSQIEGAAIMGLSLAKYGEITFKDGKVQQRNFDDFQVIRIDEAPLVTNVYIMPPGPDRSDGEKVAEQKMRRIFFAAFFILDPASVTTKSCPLLAQSGHDDCTAKCPLMTQSGQIRTPCRCLLLE
jgi:isoquinoline 1-oxidoreductase beta subunit